MWHIEPKLLPHPRPTTRHLQQTHLPGYVENADKLKAAGVDVIVCVSVNDPFVMAAVRLLGFSDDENLTHFAQQWGENQGVGDKVRMLADMHGELARALDVEVDASAKLGTKRSKRCVVE